MQDEYCPYAEGHEYGLGIEDLTGRVMAQAVVGAHDPVDGAPGGSISFFMKRITSTTELNKALDIDARVSFGLGPFGASARFGFAERCAIQSESLCLLMVGTIGRGFEQIDDPHLTPDAARLAGDPEAFAARYGSRFVRGMNTGGLFTAALVVNTVSSEQIREIEGEVSASYGLASASVKTSLTEVLRSHNVNAVGQLHCEGGDRRQLAPFMERSLDPAELEKAATVWGQTVEEHARPYAVSLAPLSIAGGAPLPPNATEAEHARYVIDRCATLRAQMRDGLSTVDFVRAHEATYAFRDEPARARVRELQLEFARALDVLNDAAGAAVRDPRNARLPEVYALEEADGFTFPSIEPELWDSRDSVVQVPDLSAGTSYDDCAAILQSRGLVAAKHVDGPGRYALVSQQPRAGTAVARGTTVTIVCRESLPVATMKVAHRFGVGIGTGVADVLEHRPR